MDKLVNKVLRFRKKEPRTKTPVEEFMEKEETEKRVISFLGHSVQDSPVHEDLKYSQESFSNSDVSPCESYVKIKVDGDNKFDPRELHKHSVSIATFIRLPLSTSILSVPGVTVKDSYVFQKHGINNTHNLLGQYLLLHLEAESKDKPGAIHMFYGWLKDIGVECNRSTITASVAEKIGSWIPYLQISDLYAI